MNVSMGIIVGGPSRHALWRATVGLLIVLIGLWVSVPVCAEPTGPPADELLEASEAYRIDAMRRAAAATIAIFPGKKAGGGGSGVVVTADGYALTNFHVTQPCGFHMKCGLADGKFYDAVLVGIDPTGDVALIKLLGRTDFPTAPLGNSDDVRMGDTCFAAGNPFLLATNLQPSISFGVVSGTHRYQFPAGTLLEYADCLQTDAAINPGNSGGPLFNLQAEVIGINGRCSFEKRGRVNVGVGYAISINQIKHFLWYLHSGRIVDHATLGAVVSTVPSEGAIVSNILESSDAYRRGLRYGDRIISLAGRQVETANEFKNVLGTLPKGWRVPLSYVREDERFDVYVRLAGVHATDELIQKTAGAAETPEPKRPEPKPRKGAPKDAPKDSEQPDNEEPKPDQANPHGESAPKEIETESDRAVAALYEAKRGFANFHFNRLHRDRVWKSWQAFCNVAGQRTMLPASDWSLSGTWDGQRPFLIRMNTELVEAQLNGPLGGVHESVNVVGDLANKLAPGGSGGMLLTLHVWQRLLVRGPDRFGDVVYLGRCPLPDEEGLYDVLVATHDVLESHFYFDPNDGKLVAIEMFPDADVDPCEIRFGEYQPEAGRMMPHRLEVRHGDRVFGRFQINIYELPESNENPS